MQRWRKDIKRCHTRIKISYNVMTNKIETQLFEKMCNTFYGVAELAIDDNLKCGKVMKWIRNLKNYLQNNNSVGTTQIHVDATHSYSSLASKNN